MVVDGKSSISMPSSENFTATLQFELFGLKT